MLFVYIYTYISLYIYIYIYRERDNDICDAIIYIYTHVSKPEPGGIMYVVGSAALVPNKGCAEDAELIGAWCFT